MYFGVLWSTYYDHNRCETKMNRPLVAVVRAAHSEMSRPSRDELATLGRRMAAAQGVTDERPQAAWIAYGRACADALAHRKPVPAMLASAPPGAAATPSLHRADPVIRSGEQGPPILHEEALPSPPRTPRPVQRGRETGRSALQGAATAVPRQAPVLCATCAQPVEVVEVEKRRLWLRGFATRVTWGLLWRHAILLAVLLAAEARAGVPWPAIAGVLVAGLVLGLWHRRSVVARVWRTLVIAGAAIYVGPMLPIYPYLLAGSLGALTLSPFLATLRRPRR